MESRTSTDDGGERPPVPYRRGDAIDRFTVLDTVGMGGMGLVLAAYDCTLDRKVALKVLRPDRGADEGRARLLREAQAMARLSHRNVVTVFESGTVGDEVYIAMELVDGETLAAWLARAPRGWRDTVALLARAGEGLAAAHRAGVVHRDFKPDNVLVGRDGEPRVSDFGLAGATGSPALAEADALSTRLTHSGMVMGTPAYMSPEQHRGEEADARSDQFSFCVTLYEALTGTRPFPGATRGEVLAAIEARRVAAPKRELPRWLRAAVLRGLEPAAAGRWPDMRALLDALARDPAAARRRVLLAGGAVLAAGALALMATRGRTELCRGGAALTASLWDEPARARVRAAFLATGRPHAAATFERVAPALERRVQAWAAAHGDACRATRVRGEQSEAMLDLRMACLESARRQIGGLAQAWTSGPVNLDGAVAAASSVGEIEACSDTAALASPIPPPRDAATARRLVDVRAAIDEVTARYFAGQPAIALPMARDAVVAARALGYAPALARALRLRGQLECEAGKLEDGLGLLYAAVQAAAEAHDDVTAARALGNLLFFLGVGADRSAEAATISTLAEAAVARAGGGDELRADLLWTQAKVLKEEARWDEALDRLRRARAIYERLHGPEHPDLPGLLHTEAGILAARGRVDEAVAASRRAVELYERQLGPDNAAVAVALNDLSNNLKDKGDLDEASRVGERNLAIRERIYPAGSPAIALALHNLAVVRIEQERIDEAHALLERSVGILSAARGTNHPSTATSRGILARVLLLEGRIAEARGVLVNVIADQTRAYGPDHPAVGFSWTCLGDALAHARDASGAEAAYEKAIASLRSAGSPGDLADALRGLGELRQTQRRWDDAIRLHEQALAAVESIAGGDPSLPVPALTSLGAAYLGAGRVEPAVATLERAVALPAHHRLRDARARFHLARALWAKGDRPRALALAGAARDALAGTRYVAELDETDRWIRRSAAP